MKQMTFDQLSERILQEEGIPLSPSEIWELAREKGYDQSVSSRGKTPWNTIGAHLYVDVRDNPKSLFLKIGTRPRRFGLKSLSRTYQLSGDHAQAPLATRKQLEFLEKDLHSFLAYYAFNYLRAHTKTIHHNKSERAKFAEWVHPDMVGCQFPFGEWQNEVVELSSAMANVSVKLYSFELKRELNFTNLREAFFQAVSNSSWSNEAYLAAADIASDEDFLDELRRLSVSFGIGIIRLNVEEPDSSEVVLPPKIKETIDWETVNKLASLNKDFRDFLARVRNDISSREIRREMYDTIFAKDELLKILR